MPPISTMPANPGAARDQWILDAVKAGEGVFAWATLELTYKNHTATVSVFNDALMIDDVRVNVSAALEQRIADVLGCMLLTPKLADQVFAQRYVQLPPMPRPITASTAAMIDQSKKIDKALQAQGQLGTSQIVSTVGKHWVLAKVLASRPGKAANYGWHFEGASFQGIKGEPSVSLPGIRVIQGVGTAHDTAHVDYSQNCVLASRRCVVDGTEMDLGDVLMDAELAGLISSEGPLPFDRQPGIPVESAGDYSLGYPPDEADKSSSSLGTGAKLALSVGAGLLTLGAISYLQR